MVPSLKNLEDVFGWMEFDVDKINELIEEIQDEIYRVVRKHIFKENPGYLVYVGRKAAHLLGRWPIIHDKGFITCQLRVLQKKIVQLNPDLPKKEEIILFTDTIHTGTEMVSVLEYFDHVGPSVKKVVTYINHKEGKKKIVESKLLHQDQIVAQHETYLEKEYIKREKPLRLFYRSRITPMDTNISYHEYGTRQKIDPDEIRDIINKLFLKFFGIKKPLIKIEERGITRSVIEYRFTIDSTDILTSIIKDLFEENNKIKLEGITFLVKTKENINNIHFTLWIDPEIDSDINRCNNDGTHFKLSYSCQLVKGGSNLLEEDKKKILCPYCITTYLSEALLSNFNDEIEGLDLGNDNRIELIYP